MPTLGGLGISKKKRKSSIRLLNPSQPANSTAPEQENRSTAAKLLRSELVKVSELSYLLFLDNSTFERLPAKPMVMQFFFIE